MTIKKENETKQQTMKQDIVMDSGRLSVWHKWRQVELLPKKCIA